MLIFFPLLVEAHEIYLVNELKAKAFVYKSEVDNHSGYGKGMIRPPDIPLIVILVVSLSYFKSSRNN
jgi:hypothetical protein